MNLSADLAQLENAELIRHLVEAEPAFVFKHPLTQASAYDSLLHKDRVVLHIKVASAFEDMYPARLDEYAALLAYHYGEAHDDKKTVEYATRAGDLAERVYANLEAIGFYTQALEAAKRVGATSDLLIHLYAKRGRVLEVTGRNDKALATYEEMREFARARGDRALEIESLLLQSTLYSTPTCFDRARAILLEDQAEGLASEIGDQKAEARALWNKLVLNLYSGELTEAIATGNRALELARRIGSPELVAYILGDLSRAKFNSEGLEESRLLEGEARAIWRSLDNKPMLADNLNMAATRAALIGEHERALALSDEGIEISKMAGSLMSEFTNTSMKFVVYFGLGDYVRALQIGTDLIRESKNRALDFALSLISSQVAWAYASIGSVDLAKRFASVARQSFSPTTSKFLGGWVWNVLAITHITLSDLEATAEALDIAQPDLMTSGSGSMIGALATTEFQFARGEFRLAVDYADLWIAKMRQLGIIAYLPDLLLVQAKSVRALGMNDRAIELLNEARVLAERIDLRRTLWKIYSLLFELELERDNLIEAERFRTSACDVIGYIADHTPDELRVTFLSQPAVRTVMARS